MPRETPINIYKGFIRSHLDYGDKIYVNPSNIKVCKKKESFQYNTSLIITVTIRETAREKLYQELQSLPQKKEEINDKFSPKIAFLMYTERVNFRTRKFKIRFATKTSPRTVHNHMVF